MPDRIVDAPGTDAAAAAPPARGRLFTQAQYLEPLAACAGPDAGWTPLPRSTGSVAPCYEKSHSWGEFVFDFEFAAAYARHGLAYYPKLVCCVPYTPVPGPRLPAGAQALDWAATRVQECRSGRYSGAHVLFLPAAELALLEPMGWLPRAQLRYVWHNAGYDGFDAFLAQLAGKKRRNIRRERAAVAASGLEIRWLAGAELGASQLARIYELYAGTYEVRGQPPYLSPDCLRRWAVDLGQGMQFCLALHGGAVAAMAFFFRDGDTLYGRHWGSAADLPGLHFELCYYQGIEYCIRHRLARFDAGVQGEHRLLRGFEPELSHSAHWFAHADFRGAIARALRQESAAIDARLQVLRGHSAFRRD